MGWFEGFNTRQAQERTWNIDEWCGVLIEVDANASVVNVKIVLDIHVLGGYDGLNRVLVRVVAPESTAIDTAVSTIDNNKGRERSAGSGNCGPLIMRG